MNAEGLASVLEKSLDGVSKAERAPLAAVYRHAERITERGLVIMDTADTSRWRLPDRSPAVPRWSR